MSSQGDEARLRAIDDSPVVARGELPGGSWVLHAAHEARRGPSFHIEFYNDRGDPTEGGGAAGFDLVTDDSPVRFLISRRGSGSSLCYIGQAIRSTRKVELGLTNGTKVDAVLVGDEMPVRLWVGFTDGTAAAMWATAIGAHGELGSDEIEEAWPTEGTTSWLPDDD